jgi:NADPH-dependent curcumin reductase CurA
MCLSKANFCLHIALAKSSDRCHIIVRNLSFPSKLNYQDFSAQNVLKNGMTWTV